MRIERKTDARTIRKTDNLIENKGKQIEGQMDR